MEAEHCLLASPASSGTESAHRVPTTMQGMNEQRAGPESSSGEGSWEAVVGELQDRSSQPGHTATSTPEPATWFDLKFRFFASFLFLSKVSHYKRFPTV